MLVNTGCYYSEGKWNPYEPTETEWDGRFLYHKFPDEDFYHILGTEPELGATSERLDKLYLPSHYKGYRIYRCQRDFRKKTENFTNVIVCKYGIDITPVKEIYHTYYDRFAFLGEYNQEKEVVPHIGIDVWNSCKTSAKQLNVFIPALGYDESLQNAIKECDHIELNNSYSSLKYSPDSEQVITVYKANTAYMFNYEGAPNENYYFVNDFERGGLIENTPYEPYREGYTFLGWYKDSDCTEIWDFETDTLPVATYNENGELEFVETRLYAKWSKT